MLEHPIRCGRYRVQNELRGSMFCLDFLAEPVESDLQHCRPNHHFAGLRVILVVLRQPAPSAEPPKGPLHNSPL